MVGAKQNSRSQQATGPFAGAAAQTPVPQKLLPAVVQVLAKKMTVLYKLAREQLSKQHHYDFGLRALKSVLVMAGALKRGAPDMTEALVLMRALRDSNLPKFVYDDVPLFLGLVGDLFPGELCCSRAFGVPQLAAILHLMYVIEPAAWLSCHVLYCTCPTVGALHAALLE